MLLGSCFSNNIGEKLQESKFKVSINPFGIIYNPVSLSQNLLYSIENREADSASVVESNGRFFHYGFHSDVSGATEEECLLNANQAIKDSYNSLQDLDIMFISLGTAWVYRKKDNKAIVANCHKIPAKNFSKELLKVGEVEESLQTLVGKLNSLFPKLRIIFTLSPVRHVKDGLHENQLSKSTLMLAIDSTVEKFACCSYFPSYEIMMDDLRDYRYYADDLIHPSAMAVEYIWKIFSESYFSIATCQLVEEIFKIKRELSHKAFHPESGEHQKFLQKLRSKINKLENKYALDFGKELEDLGH